MKRMGVDIGGTFTDLVLYDSDAREIRRHKLLTTPDAPEQAVLHGVRELLDASSTVPAQVDEITYATTVATNAVLQRKGPPTALLTTEGFRDVLLIQRQARHDLFDLFIDKPRPLLSRREIHTISERLAPDGDTLVELDEDGLRALAASLRDAGVRSVAIAFLHAYRDGAHERRAAEIVREVHPDCHVSLSSTVSPIIGEYERTNTTVTDAYVKPGTTDHLRRLQQGVEELGIRAPLAVMLSDAGLGSVDRATTIPVRMIESGPAAGAQIAAYVGRTVQADRVIAFDMGGTTAKVALIEDGRPTLSDELEVDRTRNIPGSGLPLAIPSVDLIEIGSGGGSLAGVDGRVLRVGPESAGAAPGPACYGSGGVKPTVTDADLTLGYLNPGYFLGGRMSLDVDAAREALDAHVGVPLEIDTEAAARGVYQVTNATMEQAIRAGTVQRGRDPRDYTLVATGGAAPVHAVAIARSLGIPRVICPSGSGVASAIGLLAAERRTSLARSLHARVVDGFGELADRRFAELEAEAAEAFEAEAGTGRAIEFRRRLSLRYVGQGYDLAVDVPSNGGGVDTEALLEAFHAEYEQLYGRSERGEPLEATTWRLDAILETPQLELERRGGTNGADPGPGGRRIYDVGTDRFADATVWRIEQLSVDADVPGPAVIEQTESTVVLFSGDVAHVDRHGNVVVAVGSSNSAPDQGEIG